MRGCMTIGRMPASAAPMAAPVVAFSETGESRIRSRPNSWSRSVMLAPTYHGLQRPCPIIKTLGSDARSCAWASRIAPAYVSVRISAAPVPRDPYVFLELRRSRVRRAARPIQRFLHLRADLFLDRLELG